LGDKAAYGVLSPNGRSAVERLGRDFRRVLAACFAAANTWRSSLPLRPPSALWADKTATGDIAGVPCHRQYAITGPQCFALWRHNLRLWRPVMAGGGGIGRQ
jgi:hypothetical protein